MSTSSESDLQAAVQRLAARAGTDTPILLLRLEVEFLTWITQMLVGQLVQFDRVRVEFLTRRLGELVDELSQPRIEVATAMPKEQP